ncbi:5-dehydro-4-deoxyglucarate dehydratase [Actinoalloteichus caeruleus]|uniref:5-dehydro-4-deoxyglucarate dehydratase n=1 Tax=Actinoalloteichus cyanogriseus TaxID=2893586 RepID=UPI0004AABA27|nr:5-dehydro-4-deoxyglucarate dehydratase [Actinoalloteichus caeruleus]
MKLDRVLFFPVTPFDARGAVDTEVLAEHLRRSLAHRPGAGFAACGTGEVHALSVAEQATVVATAAAVTPEDIPVFAGAGGPLPTAREQVRGAADAGAQAILLLPPYLVNAPQRGLVDYVRTVAESSPLPIVFYQRGNAVLTVDSAVEVARIPNVVGIKDGVGDLDRLHAIVLAVRDAVGEDFLFFNGLPTAELTAGAYRGIGVDLYSSAAFAFVPEVSAAFHAALGGDEDLVSRLLTGFYQPLAALRDTTPGYAVALVKAGQTLRGLDVGPVRPPLVPPTEEDLRTLSELIDTGLGIVGAASPARS